MMYARYQKGKKIILSFDLEHEAACAFTFFHAGNGATPFQGDIKEKMEAIIEALKDEVIEKVQRDKHKDEATNFALCLRCAQEINLRASNWSVGKDGFHYHNVCPALKPEPERDI